jgi:hypothetical protein
VIARLHENSLCNEHTGSVNANAHLIAAAPAMYEALKAALDYYRGVFTGNTVTDKMMSSKLEQALAQAEGTNR